MSLFNVKRLFFAVLRIRIRFILDFRIRFEGIEPDQFHYFFFYFRSDPDPCFRVTVPRFRIHIRMKHCFFGIESFESCWIQIKRYILDLYMVAMPFCRGQLLFIHLLCLDFILGDLHGQIEGICEAESGSGFSRLSCRPSLFLLQYWVLQFNVRS